MGDSRPQDDVEQSYSVFHRLLLVSGIHTNDSRHYRPDALAADWSVSLPVAELPAALLGWIKVYLHQLCRQFAAPLCFSLQALIHRPLCPRRV